MEHVEIEEFLEDMKAEVERLQALLDKEELPGQQTELRARINAANARIKDLENALK